ncbi:MAG: hypothetical protein QRY74_06255 [Chlamydia sp.]
MSVHNSPKVQRDQIVSSIRGDEISEHVSNSIGGNKVSLLHNAAMAHFFNSSEPVQGNGYLNKKIIKKIANSTNFRANFLLKIERLIVSFAEYLNKSPDFQREIFNKAFRASPSKIDADDDFKRFKATKNRVTQRDPFNDLLTKFMAIYDEKYVNRFAHLMKRAIAHIPKEVIENSQAFQNHFKLLFKSYFLKTAPNHFIGNPPMSFTALCIAARSIRDRLTETTEIECRKYEPSILDTTIQVYTANIETLLDDCLLQLEELLNNPILTGLQPDFSLDNNKHTALDRVFTKFYHARGLEEVLESYKDHANDLYFLGHLLAKAIAYFKKIEDYMRSNFGVDEKYIYRSSFIQERLCFGVNLLLKKNAYENFDSICKAFPFLRESLSEKERYRFYFNEQPEFFGHRLSLLMNLYKNHFHKKSSLSKERGIEKSESYEKRLSDSLNIFYTCKNLEQLIHIGNIDDPFFIPKLVQKIIPSFDEKYLHESATIQASFIHFISTILDQKVCNYRDLIHGELSSLMKSLPDKVSTEIRNEYHFLRPLVDLIGSCRDLISNFSESEIIQLKRGLIQKRPESNAREFVKKFNQNFQDFCNLKHNMKHYSSESRVDSALFLIFFIRKTIQYIGVERVKESQFLQETLGLTISTFLDRQLCEYRDLARGDLSPLIKYIPNKMAVQIRIEYHFIRTLKELISSCGVIISKFNKTDILKLKREIALGCPENNTEEFMKRLDASFQDFCNPINSENPYLYETYRGDALFSILFMGKIIKHIGAVSVRESHAVQTTLIKSIFTFLEASAKEQVESNFSDLLESSEMLRLILSDSAKKDCYTQDTFLLITAGGK